MRVTLGALDEAIGREAADRLVAASDELARQRAETRVFAELQPMPERPAIDDEAGRLFAGPRGAVLTFPGC